MESNIKFRSDEEEKLFIRNRNREFALDILQRANITNDNPDYNRYLAYTMLNVHNAHRFATYNDEIEQMFVDTLLTPEFNIRKYYQTTNEFRKNSIEKRQDLSGGANISEEQLSNYLNNAISSGLNLREQTGVSFPQEFYDANGGLKRIILDISDEISQSSAIGIINNTISKYSNVDFDSNLNQFKEDDKPIGPEKFFSSKAEILSKFIKEVDTINNAIDFSDNQLFDILKSGDYTKFLALRKERGQAKDNTNLALRKILASKVIFGDIHQAVQGSDINLETLKNITTSQQKEYSKKAEIINKDSKKDVINKSGDKTDDIIIDRIMLSASPFDLATQSTYQKWSSCMNVTSVNNRYIDDSIGYGSIIAYGYNSKNPQNKLSRSLIHPYTSDTGETFYKVNNRNYGVSNSAFNDTVHKIVDKFNQDKEGIYAFNNNIINGTDGLYNDDALMDENIPTYIVTKKVDNDAIIDLEEWKYEAYLNLTNIDFSKAKDIIIPKENTIIYLNNTILPTDKTELDFSNNGRTIIKNMDLHHIKDIKFSRKCKTYITNVKFSKGMKKLDFSSLFFAPSVNIYSSDMSGIEHLKLGENTDISEETFATMKNLKTLDMSRSMQSLGLNNIDFSNLEEMILPTNRWAIINFKDITFPKKMKILDMSKSKSSIHFRDCDLSQFEEIKFSKKGYKTLDNVKFPSDMKVLDLSNCEHGIQIVNCDLSQFEEIKLPKKGQITLINSQLSPKLKTLDFSRCRGQIVLGNMDLSNLNDIKFSLKSELHLDDLKLPKSIKSLDFSNQENEVYVRNIDLSQLDEFKLSTKADIYLNRNKLPKSFNEIDLNKINFDLNLDGSDLSEFEELKIKYKKPSNIKIALNKLFKNHKSDDLKIYMRYVTLPKVLDLTEYEGGADFCGCDLQEPQRIIIRDEEQKKQLLESFANIWAKVDKNLFITKEEYEKQKQEQKLNKEHTKEDVTTVVERVKEKLKPEEKRRVGLENIVKRIKQTQKAQAMRPIDRDSYEI